MNVEIAAIPDKPILCASFRGRLTVATISAALAEIDTAMDGNPAGWLIFRTYQVESMSQPAAKHLLRWITSSAKSGRLRGTAYCPNNDAMTTGSRPDVYQRMLKISARCVMMDQMPTINGVLRVIDYYYTDGEEQMMPGDLYKDLGPNDRLVLAPLGKELTKVVKDWAARFSQNTKRRRVSKSA